MFSTPEFWVFIAFILFLASAGKKAYTFLIRSLDKHTRKISLQLEEAQRLHDEALSLLNSYKKKHEDAVEQAAKIISFAETEALEFQKASQQAFEEFMKNKEKALLERITIEKEEAKSKLRKEVVEEACAIAEQLLLKDPKEREKFTKKSLEEIIKLSIGSL